MYLHQNFALLKLQPYPHKLCTSALTTVCIVTHSSVYVIFTKDTSVFPRNTFYNLLLVRKCWITG